MPQSYHYNYLLPYDVETAIDRLRGIRTYHPTMSLLFIPGKLRINISAASEQRKYTFSVVTNPLLAAIYSQGRADGVIGAYTRNTSYIQFDTVATAQSGIRFNTGITLITGIGMLLYLLLRQEWDAMIVVMGFLGLMWLVWCSYGQSAAEDLFYVLQLHLNFQEELISGSEDKLTPKRAFKLSNEDDY